MLELLNYFVFFFNWYLKLDKDGELRNSMSSEFHAEIDEGIHDFREISVLQKGTVILLLFRKL